MQLTCYVRLITFFIRSTPTTDMHKTTSSKFPLTTASECNGQKSFDSCIRISFVMADFQKKTLHLLVEIRNLLQQQQQQQPINTSCTSSAIQKLSCLTELLEFEYGGEEDKVRWMHNKMHCLNCISHASYPDRSVCSYWGCRTQRNGESTLPKVRVFTLQM